MFGVGEEGSGFAEPLPALQALTKQGKKQILEATINTVIQYEEYRKLFAKEILNADAVEFTEDKTDINIPEGTTINLQSLNSMIENAIKIKESNAT